MLRFQIIKVRLRISMKTSLHSFALILWSNLVLFLLISIKGEMMKNYIGESTRYTSSILERISCNQKEIRRKWRVTKKKKKRKIESVKKNWKYSHVILWCSKVALSLCIRLNRSERWISRHGKFLLVDPRCRWTMLANEGLKKGGKSERERKRKNRNSDHFEVSRMKYSNDETPWIIDTFLRPE